MDEGTATDDVDPLGERRPITIDAQPWVDFTDPNEPDRPPGPLVRWLIDPASGNRVVHVKSWPGRNADPHWHLSDSMYVITAGEMVIEGEGTYRPGDIRWVRGGFAYGPEGCGPDGVEYLFISLGPYDKFHPDVYPPPLGRWDDPSTWVEGFTQHDRRRQIPEDPLRGTPAAVTPPRGTEARGAAR